MLLWQEIKPFPESFQHGIKDLRKEIKFVIDRVIIYCISWLKCFLLFQNYVKDKGSDLISSHTVGTKLHA